MDFKPSARTEELREQLLEFMDDHVYPGRGGLLPSRFAESGDPFFHPPVMEELKAEARSARPVEPVPPGRALRRRATNLEYAPLAEIMGRSLDRPRGAQLRGAGHRQHGDPRRVRHARAAARRGCEPLLEGEIRSCFAMTEPGVASSDATNMQARIERDGDEYVHQRRTSGGPAARASARCKIAILMGVTDPDADAYRRHSMILVPMDTPGVTVVRTLPVFGYDTGTAATARCCSRTSACRRRTCSASEGDGLRDRAGPARPRPHPPLHARDRHGRAGARADVRARHGRVAVRQAARRPGRRAGLDRGVAHRDRAGAAAHAEGRVADGHRRQQGRARSRSPRSRSRRPDRAAGDRPRDPGARRRRRVATTGRSPRCTRARARCASPTAPTRCTRCRSPAASCTATSRKSSRWPG